jgi:predicted DNA-binding transcriptional regulator AlpA
MHQIHNRSALRGPNGNSRGPVEPHVGPNTVTLASSENDRPLMLTKEEGARLLNVSGRTIDRLLSADWMPKLVEVLGCKRFRRADLEEWIAAGCPKDWRAVSR